MLRLIPIGLKTAMAACVAAIVILTTSTLLLGDVINAGVPNYGTEKLGEDGNTGGGAFGGDGGQGGKGGYLAFHDPSSWQYVQPQWGLTGDQGQQGGQGGRGGDAVWTLTNMSPGQAFVNQGDVYLGGQSGPVGLTGAAGASAGGKGGDGGVTFFGGQIGGEPNPDIDITGTQGGAGGAVGVPGTQGTNGGGGGGGGAFSVFEATCGRGGYGAQGVTGGRGSGDNGQAGFQRTQMTSWSFLNAGTIGVGGRGGQGGQGGQGGSGGGGGGGYGQPKLFVGPAAGAIGGNPGAGGAGGAGGLGGDGTLIVASGGRCHNEATGTIWVGQSGYGSLAVQAGGELINSGAITVGNGTLSFAAGANVVNHGVIGSNADMGIDGLTNTGTIEVTNAELSIHTGASVENTGNLVAHNGTVLVEPAAAVVNQGQITGAVITNQGSLRGSGDIVGNFVNHNRLMPGESTGSVAIYGNYTEYWALVIEIAGKDGSLGEYDCVNVDGDVVIAGLAMLEVDLIGGMDEGDLAFGESFDIIRYTGSRSGAFSGIDDSGAALGSGSWSLTYDVDLGGGQRSVRLSYVPEPASLSLLALGALVPLLRRRR